MVKGGEKMEHSCNDPYCTNEGYEVYDFYGIFAGYWCDDHEEDAPGQWAYAGPDTEPLEEEV